MGQVFGRRDLWIAAVLIGVSGFAQGNMAKADEPLFGYVYTTDLLPQGKFEVEQWLTDQEGQAHGYYHGFSMRSEVEYGVTDDFQLSGYLNYTYQNASKNSVNSLTEGLDITNIHNPSKPLNAAHWDGFSIEAMYRLLSPYKDPIGLVVYIEPELGPRELGVELRGIVQKNFFDDRLVLAINGWIEFEREKTSNLDSGQDPGWVPQTGTKTRATYAEIDVGASYRFAPNWSVGLEFRNHNEYGGYTLDQDDQDHTAFFLGPNIHYGAERWFATLSILRQLSAIAYTDDQRAEILHDRLYGDEHTTWDGIRLRVGTTF